MGVAPRSMKVAPLTKITPLAKIARRTPEIAHPTRKIARTIAKDTHTLSHSEIFPDISASSVVRELIIGHKEVSLSVPRVIFKSNHTDMF